MDYEKKIDIPFGAKDSELKGWEYTIPEGMEAIIKDGKVIVKEKESEDERMREWLIDYFSDYYDRSGDTFCGMQITRILDYLEKQKEQKPVEWGEEDEERIQSILFSIGYCKDEYPNKKDYSKDIDWLKSIRPKPKKNNMITPNKEFFQWIYDRLVNVHNEDPNMDYMISFKRRIEELPVDAPSWKPSEEQMEALECAERWYSDNMGHNPVFYQLLCDLKKL